MGAKRIICQTDSKIATDHITGTSQVKKAHHLGYYHKVKNLVQEFDHEKVKHILKDQKSRANELAKLASTKKPGQHHIVIKHTLLDPSVGGKECMEVTMEPVIIVLQYTFL